MEKPEWLIYYETVVNEDVQEMLGAADTASQLVRKMFNIPIEPSEMYVAIWSKIFESIIIKLYSLEREYSNFEINIADRLIVGYSTSDNDDDEKQGSFMPDMCHLDTKPVDTSYDPTTNNLEKIVNWNMENVIEQPKIIKEISILAAKKMKEELNIQIGNAEIVMPLFVLFYEALVERAKARWMELCKANTDKETPEYELSCIWFFICVREGKDMKPQVYLKPTPTAKTSIKNDALATGKYE